jgi:hypothetical protein
MFAEHFLKCVIHLFMLSIVDVWNYKVCNDGKFKMYNVIRFLFAIFMFLYHENFDINIKAHKHHNFPSGTR